MAISASITVAPPTISIGLNIPATERSMVALLPLEKWKFWAKYQTEMNKVEKVKGCQVRIK